jgi:hypothetical protein
LGIVYGAEGARDGTPLVAVKVLMADSEELNLSLAADASHEELIVNGVNTGDRVARLPLGEVGTPTAINLRGAWMDGEVFVRGLSLIDARTNVFQALIVSDQGRYRLVHSGDVKIYENLDVLPRMFFVSSAMAVPDDNTALTAMRDPKFDPASAVVLVDEASTSANIETGGGDRAVVEILLYEPERIEAQVTAANAGWLVLTDAWYPGWEVRVDGAPAEIERADILFRAVTLPEGEHHVEWIFRPASFRIGAAVSLVAVACLLVAGVIGVARRSWA